MADEDNSLSVELEELLQFLYMCPIGLVDFDNAGAVRYVNPEAVNQLTIRLGLSAFSDVFAMFEIWWPELRRLVEHDSRISGRLITDHRITGTEAGGWWGLGLWVVRVAPNRNMLAVADLSHATEHEAHVQDDLLRFQALTNELPVVLWVQDEHGEQQWVNDTFCTFFGVTRAELEADSWQMLLHPDDGPGYIDAYMQSVAAQGPFHARTRVQDQDGRWRWMESWARPRFDSEGDFLGHLGVSADVTEAKDAQDAQDALTAHHRFQVSLSDRLAGLEDPVAIQAVAARLLSEHLGTSRVHYAEIDDTGTYAIVTAEHQVHGRSTIGRYHLDDYGREIIDDIRVGRTVVINDVTSDPRLDDAHRRATAALGIGSYVIAPVINGGSLAAFMLAFHRDAHSWTPPEIEAVKDTGQRTFLALDRARLAHQREARRSQAEFITQILTDLAGFTDPAEQYQHLAQALVPALADYATVEAPDLDQPLLGLAHRDPSQLDLLRTLRERHRIDPSAANSIARAAHGESQLLNKVTPAVQAEYALTNETLSLLAQLGPRSHLAVPLTVGDGIDAALMVGLVDPDRPPYTNHDLEFITELTQRANIVIAETAVRRSKHEIADRLQRALLPDSLHWLPGVSIEAHYQSAAHLLDVGGDWYDTYTWPTGHIAIMVGDIVGHDLNSAVQMGRLRSAAATLVTILPPEPAALLDALDTFARGRDGTTFATAAIVVIDPDGQLTYATAGHPPPLLITPDGHSERLTDAQSPPLCALTAAPRTEQQRTLTPGTLLVLYSDGLIERRGERLDTGITRIEHAIVAHQHQPLPEITERALNAAEPPTGFEDDVVLALIRFTQPVATHRLLLPARTDQLAQLRHDLRYCLEQQNITGREQRDIVLAISEAASNAIEHAYDGQQTGTITIDLIDHVHHVIAQITDHGTWRPPTRDTERGRGTPIMQALSTHYARTSSTHGTTIALELPTPARLNAPRTHGALC